MLSGQSWKVLNKLRHHQENRVVSQFQTTSLNCNQFGVPPCTILMTSLLMPLLCQICILNFARHDILNLGFFSLLQMLTNGIRNLQIIEAKCTIRSCIKLPPSLGPPPLIEDWGCLPSLEQLGLCSQNVGFSISIGRHLSRMMR